MLSPQQASLFLREVGETCKGHAPMHPQSQTLCLVPCCLAALVTPMWVLGDWAGAMGSWEIGLSHVVWGERQSWHGGGRMVSSARSLLGSLRGPPQGKLQKHQAFEAEVQANSGAIVKLDETGNLMISEGHFASETIRVSWRGAEGDRQTILGPK